VILHKFEAIKKKCIVNISVLRRRKYGRRRGDWKMVG